MWTPSLQQQRCPTRLYLYMFFCGLLQGWPWIKARLLSIDLSQIGRDLPLTKTPKGSTQEKSWKTIILNDGMIINVLKVISLSFFTQSKQSHYYMMLPEKQLNHLGMHVAARQKYTKKKSEKGSPGFDGAVTRIQKKHISPLNFMLFPTDFWH